VQTYWAYDKDDHWTLYIACYILISEICVGQILGSSE